MSLLNSQNYINLYTNQKMDVGDKELKKHGGIHIQPRSKSD
jgi:hypothetical protein